MAEENDKAFTIKDRRSFDAQGNPLSSEGEKRDADPAGNKTFRETVSNRSDEQTEKQQSATPPEINFASFVLSLSSSALYHFGEIPDPATNKKLRNLFMAKQTIDILGVLKEKTAGNLTQEEDALLSDLLYDLRMRYIRELETDKKARQE